MKYIYLFAIIFLNSFFNAQISYVFTYKVLYKPSKGNTKQNVEYFALESKNNRSIFRNLNKVEIDSLVQEKKFKAAEALQSPLLRLSVYKKNEENKIIVNGVFNNFKYKYIEKPVVWNDIKTTDSKFLSYTTSEAFTEFGKRKWQALYTEDIPIADGPYVFCGLPGLIVKAISTDGDYVFELVEVKKNNSDVSIESQNPNIKKNKLSEKIKNFLIDPASHPITFQNDFGDVFQYEFSGLKDNDYKETNKYMQDIIKQYDNFIDPEIPLITF